MTETKLEDFLTTFGSGSGFGDPQERENAEQRLQVFLVQAQQRTNNRLNVLTFALVVVGLLNVAVLAMQVFGER